MYELAITTLFRDETRFLREWVEYHLLVGFQHCFLLCNDDWDERCTVNQTMAGQWRGEITMDLFNDHTPLHQLAAWQHALRAYGPKCKWLALTDTDAFFFPLKVDTVAELLPKYDRPDIAGLAIYTCTFGTNLLNTPALQTELLNLRGKLDDRANWTANYILRPERLEPADLVRGYCVPKPGFRIVDTDGTTVTPGKRNGPKDVLRLNHYSVRSQEDWERKVKRGWPQAAMWDDVNTPIESHKHRMLNLCDEQDDSMLRFVPKLKDALARRFR